MISRFTARQLVVFLVIAVVFVGIVSTRYLQLPRVLGFARYVETVVLPEAGGIYPNANVTLRGLDVGEVTSVRVVPEGVAVALAIDTDTDLPADVRAVVRSASAIGEQYVDLQPASNTSTQVLARGASIPPGPDAVPVGTAALLDKVNTFAAALPRESLRTSIDEFYTAFNGTSGDLQRFIDSSSALLDSANVNYDSTVGLIRVLEPVLTTQRDIAPRLESAAHDLASFTDQLARSDGDLRALIHDGPDFAAKLDPLVMQLNPTVPQLLRDLASTGEVLRVYLPNVEHTLVAFPPLVTAMQSVTLPNSREAAGVLSFRLSVGDPPPCTTGFEQTVRRDPAEEGPPPGEVSGVYCKLPKDSPYVVRGARNDPCPNDPDRRGPTAESCGLHFADRPSTAGSPDPTGDTTAASYDPATGSTRGSSGLVDFVRGATGPDGKPLQTWQQLVTAVVPAPGAPT